MAYISEHTCKPLALVAALFPDRMLALVMTEVERMAIGELLAEMRTRFAKPPLATPRRLGSQDPLSH